MSNTIRSTRKSLGLTVYDLANRLGVTAGAVSQLERSEVAGTIKLSSLRSALRAMHRDVELTVRNEGMVSGEPQRTLERREERISLQIHRLLAQKVLDDPETHLRAAASNIERMREKVHGTMAQQWLDDWRDVIGTSLADTVRIMLDTSGYAVEMRQNSPFSGLTLEERKAAIERARL